MNRNLPKIKRDGVFTKIKEWIKKVFDKGEKILDPIQENADITKKYVIKINKDCFKEKLQIENKDKTLILQKRLKEKQIKVEELTDEELDEMIKLYKLQIEEKKKKIKQYRKKL